MFAQGLRNVMHNIAFVTLSYMTGVVKVRLSLPVNHAALFVNTVFPDVMDWELPLASVREAEATALVQFLPAEQQQRRQQQQQQAAVSTPLFHYQLPVQPRKVEQHSSWQRSCTAINSFAMAASTHPLRTPEPSTARRKLMHLSGHSEEQ
jgi:hypothetical protein